MPTVRLLIAAATAATLLTTPPPAGASATDRGRPAAKASTDTRVIERKVRHCANRERLSRGLRPLRPHPDLARAARDHALAMAWQGFFDHIDPEGRGPAERVRRYTDRFGAGVGENIARRSRTVEVACRLWMRSPGHRANILHPDYAYIGAGYAAPGPGDEDYVQVFGVRRRPARTPPKRPVRARRH